MITRSAKKVKVQWKILNEEDVKTLEFYTFSSPTKSEVLSEIMGEEYIPIMEFNYETEDVVLGIDEDVFLANCEEVNRKVVKKENRS